MHLLNLYLSVCSGILESDPICTVNSSSGTILDGEFLRITCDVIYAGNLVPQFVWTTPNNSTIVNATFFANSTHAIDVVKAGLEMQQFIEKNKQITEEKIC